MLLFVLKIVIAAVVIAVVSTAAAKFPRIGALILSFPTVAIISFIVAWDKDKNLAEIASLSYETLTLILLTLPFFIVMGLSVRLNLSFWIAMLLGLLVSGLFIGAYMYLSTKSN